MCGILVAIGIVADDAVLDDLYGNQLQLLRHRTRQRGSFHSHKPGHLSHLVQARMLPTRITYS
jgi:hypothetical protein